MTAPEWIQLYGRFIRQIGADMLRRRLERQPGRCTWCDRAVPAGRRRWCSAECVEAFNLRCSSGHIRFAVLQRDQGVCALCGRRGQMWEADHVVPVAEGGGLCGLDGYQTACLDCHRDKTNQQRARRPCGRPGSHKGLEESR